MKLYFYSITEQLCDIIPAPPHRDWMDAFPDRHPYRCLPLAIANTAGWQILCPCDLEIEYNGGPKIEDIKIRATDGFDVRFAAETNFSRGIFTFYTNFIFQTEPGWQLLATGPLNEPKDGFYPLTGIIETDWLPYTFTMNYQLTRPGTFHYKKGEPFCQIIPIPKNYLEDVEPELYKLEDNPVLMKEKTEFQERRTEFRKRMAEGDPEALKQGWQRFYFRGQMPTGLKAPDSHRNKMRLNKIVDKRGTPVESLYLKSGTPEGAAPKPAEALPKEAVTPQPKPPETQPLKATSTSKITSRVSFDIQPVQKTSVPKPQEPQKMQNQLHEDHGRPEDYPAITSQSQTSEVMYFENFLSADQCAELIKAFERNKERTAPTGQDTFFKDRVIWMSSLSSSEIRARTILQQARHAASLHVANFFKETIRLYDDEPQLVKWMKGMSMPAHADNEHPDGSQHGTPWRKYAAVTFINDSYEGGNFYLEKLKLRIPAKTGLLVGFKGDMSHMHGVTEVLSGERYTMPMWLSEKPTDTKTIAQIF